MSRQLSEAVRIELRGSDILNSKAEYNKSRIPRLRVDMEGWKQKQQSLDKDKEPTNLMEGSEEQDYEISITERVQKRKGGSEDTEIKQKKPKRIKLDKLEGSPVLQHIVEEILPDGWWQEGVNAENNNGEHKRALSPQSDVRRSLNLRRRAGQIRLKKRS